MMPGLQYLERQKELAAIRLNLSQRKRDALVATAENELRSVFDDHLSPAEVGEVIYRGKTMVGKDTCIHLDKLFTQAFGRIESNLPYTGDKLESIMTKLHKALYHHFKKQTNDITEGESGVKALDKYLCGRSGQPIDLDALLHDACTSFMHELPVSA